MLRPNTLFQRPAGSLSRPNSGTVTTPHGAVCVAEHGQPQPPNEERMADNFIKFRMVDLVKGLTMDVKITGMAIWKYRLWLGMQILKIACRVIGCGIKIDSELDAHKQGG